MDELLPFPNDQAVLSPDGVALARGVARLFHDVGYCALVEFPLGIGRRVDVAGIRRDGTVAIAEVKSSLADFRADKKWTEYLDFCDVFYFAVPETFPRAVLPADSGLIIADRFGGQVLRPAPSTPPSGAPLAAARRKALTLRFARAAAFRLSSAYDPSLPLIQDVEF